MTKIFQIISKCSRISVLSFPYIVVPTLQYIKADLVKKRFSQVWKVDLERQHFLCPQNSFEGDLVKQIKFCCFHPNFEGDLAK